MNYELKTIELFGIKLDIYYSVYFDGDIQIESIEDINSTQDLMPIMDQNLFEKVKNLVLEK